MDALFCDSDPRILNVTLGEINDPIYLTLSTGDDMQTDDPETIDYDRYIDIRFIKHSLEPLSFGTALGFGMITLFVLFTFGVSKALSLVRIKK